jgi:hypothetical protein
MAALHGPLARSWRARFRPSQAPPEVLEFEAMQAEGWFGGEIGRRCPIPMMTDIPLITGSVGSMKCKKCGRKYSADVYQGAPGGSSAPGVFLVFALVLLGGTTAAFLLGAGMWKWVLLGIGVFVLVQVPSAWGYCRGNGGYAEHRGVDCPECGFTNTLYPWSL